MAEDWLRVAIRAAEDAEPPEQWALLCFLAGRSVTLDERELRSAVRRSELLLAAGGDPRRRLQLYGRAVTALAEDLDHPILREQFAAGLVALRSEAEAMQGAAEALRLLARDPDLAWQSYAMALLAEALAGED